MKNLISTVFSNVPNFVLFLVPLIASMVFGLVKLNALIESVK